MSGKGVGYIRLLWTNFRTSLQTIARTKEVFIGKDHIGNLYYEKHTGTRHAEKLKRPARYIKDVNPKSIAELEAPLIPKEWEAWLRHKRKDPPTDKELEENYVYLLRTQMRSEELEEKSLKSGEYKQDEQFDTKEKSTEFPRYSDLERKPGLKRNPDEDGKG
ncbi:hypothetical protein LOTGIDRAFT_228046 [Lottia gigantea]|uniref:NADH dehydrogenase [ubiquinone] 1 alpha subcomplex subunit 12 n=1 Tax=Lottia gigantea TaxID=225164 RepID=V4CSG1_LOTGI|nr:hypothetical protein LOTGIDRAFT_228046 [Lottia gigantea]ESP05470.1 hypothetical protein LOTGIDRAFT_228046 [Lottia gigantea]